VRGTDAAKQRYVNGAAAVVESYDEKMGAGAPTVCRWCNVFHAAATGAGFHREKKGVWEYVSYP
jgi:hypothetical protein